jgi:putative ABC transport system permease protein
MTGLIASIVEAYGELRVNKGRVLLSLIGVAFSVFTLTAVLGAGGMLQGALQQSTETWNGRPTVIEAANWGGSEESMTPAEQDQVVLDEFDRMGIDQRSRRTYLSLSVQTPQGVVPMDTQAVDPAYGDMYRQRPDEGRWFSDSDQNRLAPAVVLNRPAYEMLGSPQIGAGTVTLYSGDEHTEAVIIGVLPENPEDFGYPSAFTAAGTAHLLPGVDDATLLGTSYLAWVPEDSAMETSDVMRQHLQAQLGGGFDANPNMGGYDDGFQLFAYAIIAVAVVILILGAMGLVNISLVTVRFRVREIGIRRSYGATGMRIFFGVLMESVVATVLAGVIGVGIAVALVKAPFVDLPAVPVSAVLIGLGSATLVGILAGALPALIATRIKVIDAIRT